VNIIVQVEPAGGSPPDVDYRWDTDTDILTANLRAKAVGEGMSGSVELTGSDGSWLVLDVSSGRIHGIEVAVWPDVRKRSTLAPPGGVEYAKVTVPSRRSQPGIASVEVGGALIAEADEAERTIHFRLGNARGLKTVRIASDVLIDVDGQSAIGGVWLLNVPPFPTTDS